MFLGGNGASAGPLVVGCLVCLAIGFRGFAPTKPLAFTAWLFTAVAASLYYPQFFGSWGGVKSSLLIVPLMQIIMFGMGSHMSLNDFAGIIKMPKGVFIGVVVHYMIMPMTAFCISRIFSFPPEITAGIILIGCVPSGLASNVMCYISRANVPLGITIGAVSTLLAPFVTPVLMKYIAGQYIEISVWNMMFDILNMIILPLIAGFIFKMFYNAEETKKSMAVQLPVYFVIIALTGLLPLLSKQAAFGAIAWSVARSAWWFFVLPMAGAAILRRVLKGDQTLIKKILSSFSMIGIAVIITVTTAAGRESLLAMGALLIFTSFLHNITGYVLGYGSARLFRMSEQDCRTIAFECGMQNAGMASGLAMQMGKIATVGLAPAVFSPLMNVTGSVLASFWRGRPPKEGQTELAEPNNNRA